MRLLALLVSCSMIIASCTDESPGPSSSSSATTNSAQVSQYVQNDTSSTDRRTYSNIDANRALSTWLEEAANLVVFVDNSPPDWLPGHMAQLKQKKPALTSIFVTRVPMDEYYGARAYVIPKLKASYIIIDKKYVILNPIYDSSTRGIMMAQGDVTSLNDHLRYTSWLIGTDI